MADGGARRTTRAAKASTGKAATAAKASTGKAATAAKTTGARATRTAQASAAKAKETARRTSGTVRATTAARAGRVEDARRIAGEADLGEGAASKAIAEADALHYDVEVNKRGLSAAGLTKTLNQRWENGWRLAHVLEQRGNTVLVFEKRS